MVRGKNSKGAHKVTSPSKGSQEANEPAPAEAIVSERDTQMELKNAESATADAKGCENESQTELKNAEFVPASVKGSESDSQTELQNALADVKTSDLQEMAKRLHRSCEAMTEFIEESLKEQEDLKKENLQLHDAIDTWAKQTNKLNITSYNLVDPNVEEGPLDFVGRYWEQMRPRNNQVLLNEHVGDLKKNQIEVPDSLNATIQEVTNKVSELQAQATEAADLDNLNTVAQVQIANLKETVEKFDSDIKAQVEKIDSDIKAQAAGIREKVESFNESFKEKSLTGLSGITEKMGTLDDLNAQAASFKESSLAGLTGLTEKVQAGQALNDFNAQAASLKEKSLEGLNGLTEKVGGLTALWGGVSRQNIDEEEEVYVSDEEGTAEEKMLRDQKRKQEGASSAILNSATPLSKDKRGMVPNKADSEVDANTLSWLKANRPKQEASGLTLIDGFSGLREKFTLLEDVKAQAAGLKEKVNSFDADGFRETSMDGLKELKEKSLSGFAGMTASMGFGSTFGSFWGGSSQQLDREEQASSASSSDSPSKQWKDASQWQHTEVDPAARQIIMSKDDATASTAASTPKASDSLASPKNEARQEQEEVTVLEEQAPSATDVVVEEQKKEEQAEEEDEEEMSSSVLIEANITLDDGSVEVLRLRAVDRCVDVAAKFLHDNNLKEQQFKEPLTAWLKSVESSAETFPVKAKGDLFEIRQQFSKSKNKSDAFHGSSMTSMDGTETFA